ncbi:ATP-binding protein [Natranaerofaba carboxydovora]|uniref:ATP-binding protein n=1 Tax=Natranaerofaba carboxydovora TaxID=2742683 RepID=UPI001F130912|nr:ATP-binding protein [Natranaerofaba carboxydovora]UMZ74190.1 Sensor protein ZraS [Natranaerofaba carboxydovora]
MAKRDLLSNLTGVGSSKLSYYTELKDKTQELEERNTQLEIINEIAKSIKLDVSLKSILKKIAFLLNKVIPIDTLALYPKNSNILACVRKSLEDNDFVDLDKTDELEKLQINFDYKARPESCLENRVTIFPLKAKSNYLGFLIIKVEDNVDLDVQKGEFLVNLTDLLSIGIENSSLYNEVLSLNKRWEETFKAITDQIYVIDKDYNLLRYNDATKNYYQLREDTAGEKCYKAFHNKSRPCGKCPMKKMFKLREPVQKRKKIGEDYFDVYSYPAKDKEGQVFGGVISERNITEKLMMESQLIQSAKLKATGEMAAGVAHEINNPLTTILGNSQLLLSELDEDDERKILVKRIVESGKRCKNIIKKLLTFAKEEGSEWEKTCLNECVNDVLEMITYQLEKKGINIIFEKGDVSFVTGNKQQLEQVIINFIFNASDAVENEISPEIKIQTGLLEINEKENDKEMVYVTIADNGCGIAEKERENLFQPFYTTKDDNKEGYGLGLFVSMGIIKNHNGEIKFKSEEGKGSSFTLYIPV